MSNRGKIKIKHTTQLVQPSAKSWQSLQKFQLLAKAMGQKKKMERIIPSKILVCGSRTWTDRGKIVAKLSAFPAGTTIVHGGCGGADSMAAAVAIELGMRPICYAADWHKGRAGGPARNTRMLVREKPALVIAFVRGPLCESLGTADCVRKARTRGIRVELVYA
jgi:hypothetical protein